MLFFSSRRRHTRLQGDWSSDVCSSDLASGDEASWLLATVPKGEVVGEVRLIQAWKPSPFDRWRMTWRGLKRISPHLVLKTISGSNPVETVVNVDSIKPPEDPRLGQEWKT